MMRPPRPFLLPMRPLVQHSLGQSLRLPSSLLELALQSSPPHRSPTAALAAGQQLQRRWQRSGRGNDRRAIRAALDALSPPEGTTAKSQVKKGAENPYEKAVIPGTFVSLPLARMPRHPVDLGVYLWNRIYSKAQDFYTIVAMKFVSMPSWTSRPRFGTGKRGTILAMAKALHMRLNQAIAAGDDNVIRQLCGATLRDTLLAVIDRRHPLERMSWELVQYHSPFLLPRIVSNRVMFGPGIPVTHQVVVAIESTQRLKKFNGRTGEEIPGSEKTSRQTEYMAFVRAVNRDTWVEGPWKILGSVKATTPEMWVKEQEALNTLQA